VLLTGDIEKLSESRLLKLHAKELPSTMLVVAHHGSKSSSSQDSWMPCVRITPSSLQVTSTASGIQKKKLLNGIVRQERTVAIRRGWRR